MIEESTNKAFCEVYDIIMHMEKKLYNKIPSKFIDMIKQNKDTNYKCNIDYSCSINEQELLHETKIILSIIYRDYLCTKEERERLIEKEREELIAEEERLCKEYDYSNLFQNKSKQEKKTKLQEEQAIVQYKESIIKRILKFFISKVFKRQ